MEQLKDDQLQVFDQEYVNEARWAPIKRCIDQDFPNGEFTFLDVGGGNGVFADKLLAAYPKAKGVVLDNSELLLGRNRPNPRKQVQLASVEDLAVLGQQKFDIVSFNWLLHHLVSPTYRQSRANIDGVLRASATLLTDRGRISINENMYNGLWVDGLPSWIVYQLTVAKAIKRLIRKAGANTAGTGVCFLSQKQWQATVTRAGLDVLRYTNDEVWFIPKVKRRLWKAFLHIKELRCGHFWLRANSPKLS